MAIFWLGKQKHQRQQDADTDMNLDEDKKIFFLYVKDVACILWVNYATAFMYLKENYIEDSCTR